MKTGRKSRSLKMKTGRRSRSHRKRSAVVETTAAEAEVLKLQELRQSQLPRKSKSKVASAEVVTTEAVLPWDMRVSTIQAVTTGPV